MVDEAGNSKCFGFVNFYTEDEAEGAASLKQGFKISGVSIKTKGPKLLNLQGYFNTSPPRPVGQSPPSHNFRPLTDCSFSIMGRKLAAVPIVNCLDVHCPYRHPGGREKKGSDDLDAGALNCIIKRRLYRGKISYLPYEAEPTEQTTTQTSDSTNPKEQSDEPQQEDSDKLQRDQSDKPPQQEESETVSSSESVTIDLEEEKEELKEEALTTATIEQTGTGQETHPDTSAPTSVHVETQTTNSQSTESAPSVQDSQQQTRQQNFAQFGPKADLLPPLSGPVPENWETIEREFMAVTFLMIPHMANNFFGDLVFSIGTGKIRIVICGGEITRLGMFGLLTKADTGQHLEMEGVLRKNVRAFRLEPRTAPGMLTIDGEEVYYGPLQCQIHPTLARVMSRKRRL